MKYNKKNGKQFSFSSLICDKVMAKVKRGCYISLVTVKKKKERKIKPEALSNCYATNDVVTSDLWSNYQFWFESDKTLDEIQQCRRRF